MPWIRKRRLFFYIALLLIFIMAIRMPIDTDMWWHLKAGEQSWLHKQIYTADTFSHTKLGQSWINHSWLCQVVMYLLYTRAGFYGLSIWVALCAAGSMALIHLQMEGNPFIKALVLLLAAITASVVWSPRPQVMSLFVFSLMGYILHSFQKTRRAKTLFWAVPLFMLWANLHGGYVLGFILLGSLIVGEVFNQALARDIPGQLEWGQIGQLAGLVLVSWLAILVNPYGIGIWKIPFNTVGVETLQDLISEWASPDFHQAFQQPFLWLLFLSLAAMALSPLQVSGTELVGTVLFGWAALVARRNFGPFAIVIAPVISRHLSAFLKDWLQRASVKFPALKKLKESLENRRDFNVGLQNLLNTTLITALLAAAVWKALSVNQPELRRNAELTRYPVKATAYLQENRASGNLLNEYNWGGYLIWNLPDVPVFVDGRTDLFGDEILEDYLAAREGRGDWEEILEQYDISTILLGAQAPLVNLADQKGWRMVYKDAVAVVLIAE